MRISWGVLSRLQQGGGPITIRLHLRAAESCGFSQRRVSESGWVEENVEVDADMIAEEDRLGHEGRGARVKWTTLTQGRRSEG